MTESLHYFLKDSMECEWLKCPIVYPDEIQAVANKYDISPFLMLAIIKNESVFQPYSESYAGARGLAQIMPETGERIADQLNISPFDAQMLYDYKYNLEFGGYELSRLIDDSGGDWEQALARYNAGDDRIERWKNLPIDSQDFFVENVDYQQTRHYIKRVMADYWRYVEAWGNAE